MNRAIRFRVSGTVQGVGFRDWTCRAARSLGLSGWVRNESDGSVTGMAEGRSINLDAFQAQFSVGPAFAKVTDVEVLTADAGEAKVFEVRR